MNREELIQAVKERNPLMRNPYITQDPDYLQLVVPTDNDNDSFTADHYFPDEKATDSLNGSFECADYYRLATPEDLAKFPSYRPLEQPTAESESLKGSTEEPLTDHYQEFFNYMANVHGLTLVESEVREIVRLAYPLREVPDLISDTEVLELLTKALQRISYWNNENLDTAFQFPKDIYSAEGELEQAIEKLRARERLLPSNPESPSNEWVPVSTPPEKDGKYLIWDNGYDTAGFYKGKWKSFEKSVQGKYSNFRQDINPTHWMLPSPPTTKD